MDSKLHFVTFLLVTMNTIVYISSNMRMHCSPLKYSLDLSPKQNVLVNCSMTLEPGFQADDWYIIWTIDENTSYIDSSDNPHRLTGLIDIKDKTILPGIIGTFLSMKTDSQLYSYASFRVETYMLEFNSVERDKSGLFNLECVFIISEAHWKSGKQILYNYREPENLVEELKLNLTVHTEETSLDKEIPKEISYNESRFEKEANKPNTTKQPHALNLVLTKPISSRGIQTLSSIVKQLAHNISSSTTEMNVKQKKEVIKNIVQSTSNVMAKEVASNDVSNDQDRLNSVSSVTLSLEEIALKLSDVANVTNSFSVNCPRVNLSIIALQENCINLNYSSAEVDIVTDINESNSVNKSHNTQAMKQPVVIFVLYSGVSNLFSKSNQTNSTGRVSKQILLTDIIGVAISKKSIFRRIRFRLSHQRLENYSFDLNNHQRRCVYWNPDHSSWHYDGCTVLTEGENYTHCECNHLTNFAVIMDFTGLSKEHHPTHKIVLSIISYSGCLLSLIFSIIVGIGYEFARRYSTGRKPKRESNLTIILYELIFFTISAANITFIVGIEWTQNSIICGIFAGLLHFFLLLQYEWMVVVGIFYVIIFTKPYYISWLETHSRYLLLAIAFLPVCVVVTSAAVQHEDFGSKDFCWLSNSLIWAFIGPFSFILAINIVLLVILIYQTERQNRNTKLADVDANQSWIMSRKVKYRYELIFVFTLGITWVFGYPNIEIVSSLISSYLFSLFNAYQGFFLCFICGNWTRVLEGYSQFLMRHKRLAKWFCPWTQHYIQRRNSRSSSGRNLQFSSETPKYTESWIVRDSSSYRNRCSISWIEKTKTIPYIDGDSVAESPEEIVASQHA